MRSRAFSAAARSPALVARAKRASIFEACRWPFFVFLLHLHSALYSDFMPCNVAAQPGRFGLHGARPAGSTPKPAAQLFGGHAARGRPMKGRRALEAETKTPGGCRRLGSAPPSWPGGHLGPAQHPDDDFRAAADHVLRKNEELYRRLS
jgi:hypothetical protein